MDIKTELTFKQFLQDKTLNADKNELYYQWYDVKILRAFHKHAMIKQQIYKNILARQSGMGYSPGIQFQTILINVDEAKALTMNNQPGKSTDKKKWCRCGFLELLRITSKEFPVGIFTKTQKEALEIVISQKEGKK